MASEEDNEARLTKVEREVRLARSDAAAALVLGKGADRDVASFGEKLAVHKKLIEAVRETQVTHSQILDDHTRTLNNHTRMLQDHTRTLEDHTRTLKDHGHRLSVLDNKVDSLQTTVREGFARQAVGQTQITVLLNRIIDDKNK